MSIGERIKAARKNAGMTQAELASKLNIPFQSISQWERDIRKPKYETIVKIAHALGVTPVSLVEPRYTNDELIDLYIHGAKVWANDFRFTDEQKIRIGEFLVDSTSKLKEVINAMADADQSDGKILMNPHLQRTLDDISNWTANALKYVNSDYSEDP